MTTLKKLIILIALAIQPGNTGIVVAQQEKTSVCHITETYDFGHGSIAIGVEITIADPAVSAHIAHGDSMHYIQRSLPDGRQVCVSDRDSDGIGDDADVCPDEAGVPENGGCPGVDSDGDGVLDSSDICPGTPDLSLYGNPYVDANGCVYLPNASLIGADLSGTALNNANLSGANLYVAILTGADLSRAALDNANLSDAYMVGANLSGANLTVANLGYAYLDGGNLSGADLTDANLWHASLSNADLSGANLTRTDLRHANLTGADLTGVHWENTTCPEGTNSDSNGLGYCTP